MASLTHLVKLRPRAKAVDPNITDRTLGNMLWFATAKEFGSSNSKLEQELGTLSGAIRAGIEKMNGEFIKILRRHNEAEVQHFALESLKGISYSDLEKQDGLDAIAFTSWCRLGFYDVDIGWGKPVWIHSVGVKASVYFKEIFMMDSKDDEGIEAWVNLDENDMELLR